MAEKKTKKNEKKETNWKNVSMLFAVLFMLAAGLVFLNYMSSPAKLSQEDAMLKALTYINAEQLDPGVYVTIDNVREISGVYELNVTLQEGTETSNFISYITTDGKFFFQGGFEVGA